MKSVSLLVGALGILAALVGVIGRFKGAPSISICTYHFAASSAILVGNTLLVAAILLRLLGMPDKKD